MGTKIPQNADISLMKAQVDSARGNKVNLAEFPLGKHVLDLDNRRAVKERMAAHQSDAMVFRKPDQCVHFTYRLREWLLDQYVLPGFDGPLSDLEVG